jgi:hypothetical protein
MIDKKFREKATDNIYELEYFNSNGVINSKKLNHIIMIIFLSVFIVSTFTLYTMEHIDNGIPLSVAFSLDFLMQFIFFNIETVFGAIIGDTPLKDWYINQLFLSSAIAIIPAIIFYLYKIKQAKFQAILSSAGLSQYYFFKKVGKTIYLKFKDGEKNSYTDFISQSDNLSQMLKKDNLQFKRWVNNGVMIQYSDTFPKLKDLSKLDIKKLIKPNKLFLGIGLPNIGERYNKKDLIKGKYLARYLNFTDIPQGVANLGSSGGGKSNTMNQYLYSIFANFDKIHSFYMVDFKGGIEAEPIKDLEDKYKTGKIQIFDDNRLALYKALKRLYFINKSRMKYLKDTKQKKFTTDFIILLFDELAEILDYNPTTKEERQIQDKITFYLESLLRTGRSQGFKIFYSTQSYLSTSSGLTSGMKNNTKLKIAHQLGSNLQVGSIKPVEELNEIGINPTQYDVGKNVVINEADNTIYEVRSLYIPDNFTETINIKSSNSNIETILKPYYYELYKEQVKDLETTNQEDDTIYSLNDLAIDLNLNVDPIKKVEEIKTQRPKSTISQKIKSKKIEKASKVQVDNFINDTKVETPILKNIDIANIKNEVNSLTPKKDNLEVDSFLKNLK